MKDGFEERSLDSTTNIQKLNPEYSKFIATGFTDLILRICGHDLQQLILLKLIEFVFGRFLRKHIIVDINISGF